MVAGRSVFFTVPARCGKTYLMMEKSVAMIHFCVCAATCAIPGVAASQVEGATVQSLAGFQNGDHDVCAPQAFVPESVIPSAAEVRMSRAMFLIIDQVSKPSARFISNESSPVLTRSFAAFETKIVRLAASFFSLPMTCFRCVLLVVSMLSCLQYGHVCSAHAPLPSQRATGILRITPAFIFFRAYDLAPSLQLTWISSCPVSCIILPLGPYDCSA